ncbi:MAG TPA: flagellar basal body P-ring formation chaperone FlgA [Rhizomicrobium sp.]|nr:flagellar basal body P-ring formation chaperone FlgA [Rhizomicrobium sp.]
MKRLIFLLAFLAVNAASAETGVRIVVPARDIARGQNIESADLAYGFAAPGSVTQGTATSMDSVVGMQARRLLRAGQSMRIDDVRPAVLVTKGMTVTMTFEAPGVTLTALGRAMSEGGLGETVTVLNPASYRQVAAVVIGPGAVRASPITNVVGRGVATASLNVTEGRPIP